MVRVRTKTILDRRYRQVVSELGLLRRNAFLTQAELAARTGLGQPDISKIEAGQRRIDIIEFVDWIAACEASTEDMIGVIERLRACPA